MRHVNPVILVIAAMLNAIATAILSANNVFKGHTWVAWCLFGVTLLLLAWAGIDAAFSSRREQEKLLPRPKQAGLPEHRPNVRPSAYGKEGDACGLTIANPGYAASDVHIPPVPVAWSGYTLIFPDRVPLLTERDHHRLIVARLAHSAQPGFGGEQLLAVMRSANIDSLKFAIVYKDEDSREYRSNCEIERTANAPSGLAVGFLNQELVKDL